MKIIFLDIDGVLNTTDTIRLPEVFVEQNGIRIGFNLLNKFAIENLNRVTDRSGAKIVISSSWRVLCNTPERFKILCQHLKNEGVTGEIIGRTPTSGEYAEALGQPEGYGSGPGQIYFGYCRGKEIQMWLDQNPGVSKFVIVDDSSDMDHLMDKLVRTIFELGITNLDADRMLNQLLD